MLVVVASVAFVLILVWRFRPQLAREGIERPMPKKLAAQLEAAKTSEDKAVLLYQAGQAALTALRYGSAENYFRRALRVQPDSSALVDQVATALARRPRGLEALLWRRLSDARYEGAERTASIAAMVALIRLYDRTPKQRHKASALRNVLRSLDAEAIPQEPTSSIDVSA